MSSACFLLCGWVPVCPATTARDWSTCWVLNAYKWALFISANKDFGVFVLNTHHQAPRYIIDAIVSDIATSKIFDVVEAAAEMEIVSFAAR